MSDNTTNITRDEDITRDEQWLADIRTAAQGGSDYYELDPIIRKEYYYSDIITALKNGGGGGGGTSDYTQLTNKPEINGTTLTGNKSSSDLGLQDKVLGAWTAGTATTHSTPASTDTVLQALEKIDNNQRNDETNILTEQQKTTGMDNGGDNYISINGIPIYCDTSEPNGVIIPNALGVGWGTGTHTYTIGANLFNYQTMAISVENAILDASGAEISSENWVISDYIPCSGTSFTIGYVGGNTPAICLYDKNKQIITGKSYNTGGASSKQAVNITSQSTARYIRFSYCLASGASYDDISTIMLNKGNSLQTFVAFSGSWT